MKWNNKNDIIISLLLVLVVSIIGLILILTIKQSTTTPSPVEEIRIDSVRKENTKLIIEVKHLDSIKDAKVIEVKSLDNDSTLKLFYQLIGK